MIWYYLEEVEELGGGFGMGILIMGKGKGWMGRGEKKVGVEDLCCGKLIEGGDWWSYSILSCLSCWREWDI